MADLEGDEDNAKDGKEVGEDKVVIDLTNQHLTSIELDEEIYHTVSTLILDNNDLTKLDCLEKCKQLCQFSAINNDLVRMHNFQALSSLTVLSLSSNKVTSIESIKELSNLAWLDLSCNSIEVIENLPINGKLHYLDLSGNEIGVISDLSEHVVLKTLLLHSNHISSLKLMPVHLPESLAIMSLADNEIFDLNEVCYLSGLQNLQQLSIGNNPCVIMTAANLFDYRPFVWNWCPSLVVLDGFLVSEKERLLGEWLYSQGKGRHYSSGEHSQLVEYLASTCPLTSSEQLRTEEDSKLSQILTQQRRYQQQLHDHHHHPSNHYSDYHHQFSPTQSSGVSSPRLRESTRSASTSEANTLERDPSTSFSHSVDASTEYSTQPYTDSLRFRQAWAAASQWQVNDTRRQQSHTDENLALQDLTQDDAKSNDSLLDSDSVYLPFNIPASPIVLRRPFTAPAKPQPVTKSPSPGNLPPSLSSPLDRPATVSGTRSNNTSNKYESLEQRPIKPLNQNFANKPVFKPTFDIAPPVSSNSEPVLSQPPSESNVPPTACSQDYDSSSEQTTSESEPVLKNKQHHQQQQQQQQQTRTVNSEQHPHLAKVEDLIQQDEGEKLQQQTLQRSNSSPPSDKLNLIKSVAGSKKAERSTPSTALLDKAKAATKLRSAKPASMRTLPSHHHHHSSSSNTSPSPAAAATTSAASAATTASSMAASALMRAHLPRSALHHLGQGDGKTTEHGDESSPSSQIERNDSSGHYRSSKVTNADSKQMKSRLNMERMELKKDPGSYANVRDSGFLSRPSSDAVLDESQQAGLDNKAATAIQAYWRGYWAREHNTKVVSVRKEIRARRAEDHIMLLRKDLERNQKLYEEEKRLRILQMEAIKLLYQEVQALKSQRVSTPYNQNVTDIHYQADGHGTLSPSATNLSGLSTGYSEMNRTQELEQTCIGLQTQVTQLQEALDSVSSAVFRTNSLDGTNFDLTDHSHNVQVMPYTDQHAGDPHEMAEASRWGSIPHSLSPFPSEEEDVYYCRVPVQGAPTPPRRLQLLHFNHNSLLLSWQPSLCLSRRDYDGDGNKHIIGYRVFVNDQLKAFICQKNSALVKGLNPTTTYKFYVKALSGLGESFESNIIMAKLAMGQEKHHFIETSDSTNSDNSEKEEDTTENIEKQKRRNRKLRKSPRSVEKRRVPSSKLSGQSSSNTLLSQQPVEFFEDLHDGNNSNNSSIKSQDGAPILTQAKLHTHRRNRSRDLHTEGLVDTTTSKESSPAAGAIGSTAYQAKVKDIPHAPYSSKHSSPSSGSYSREGPRRLPESPSAGGGSSNSSKLERMSSLEGKERSSLKYSQSPTQDESVKGVSVPSSALYKDSKDSPTPGSKKESPSSGSSRRESPVNRRDSPGLGSIGHSNISPSCGSEGEQQQQSLSKISPKPGRDPSSPIRSSLETNQSMSSTFTVDKGSSFLESVNAITETALGSRPFDKGSHRDRILHTSGSGSKSHKRVRGRDYTRDYQLRSEKSKSTPELTLMEGSRKSGSDGEKDVLSVHEALRLGIGKTVHREQDELKEGNGSDINVDLASKLRGHRRKRSKDLDSKIDEWKKGEGSSDLQQGDERKENEPKSEDQQQRRRSQTRSEEEDVSSNSSNLPPTKDGRPVLDGRRRHSSGSGPSSPIIMAGERQGGGGGEERGRMSVGEMIEQRAKSLKSSSLNSLSGRSSEDSGSRQDINKRTPSSESLPASGYKSETSKRTISNESLTSVASSKGDSSSKRTHSSDSLMSIRTDTSKRSHSNESLPGSARTDNSKRSPSNESLPESIREERESDLSPTSSQSSVPVQQTSQHSHHHTYGRHHSGESSKETANKDTSTSTSTGNKPSRETTGSVVSKLLLRMESLTRNNSTSVKETKESLMNRKLAAEGSDGSGSKPPSDDERRSGRRSRNLSESDGEACASDAGSQLPPKAPSESSSGSHSDDNRHHSRRRHQRTPSDHRPATSASVAHQESSDPRRPAHSPIIMEGGRLPKSGSSSVRRNQSFHGLLPSKHPDTKTNISSNEEISPSKPEEQSPTQNQPHPSDTPPSRPRSHLRSRTPSPARTRKPILSAAHLTRKTSDSSNN